MRLGNVDLTCHAILLTGGSAFGLGAADGVVRYLSERDVGFKTAARPVPIVPAAVIYDLGVGSAQAVPGPEAGYRAATGAKGGKVARGTVGAGTGATVAKIGGPEGMVKGGVGTSSLVTGEGMNVGAIAVVNPTLSRTGQCPVPLRRAAIVAYLDGPPTAVEVTASTLSQ